MSPLQHWGVLEQFSFLVLHFGSKVSSFAQFVAPILGHTYSGGSVVVTGHDIGQCFGGRVGLCNSHGVGVGHGVGDSKAGHGGGEEDDGFELHGCEVGLGKLVRVCGRCFYC